MTTTLRLLLPALCGAVGLLGTTAGHAQTAPAAKGVEIKFGKPEPADFEAKNFVADSAAPAVVLYDAGNAHFFLDGLSFRLETERTTRIKIQKEAGYEVATVEVPLFHRGTIPKSFSTWWATPTTR